MQRKITFSVNEFYHVYNRGNNKGIIFTNDDDKKRFQKLLYVCNSTKPVIYKSIQGRSLDEMERGEIIVDIGVYCLMSNHFHLLLREKTPGGITAFLGKVSTAYSMYFNRRYERTGGLFEGRFRAEHADTDDYLQYLFAYIHLNPVKIIEPNWKDDGIRDYLGVKQYLSQYHYSSYLDYAGMKRPENDIINKVPFPDYFSHEGDFNTFINDWLLVKKNSN